MHITTTMEATDAALNVDGKDLGENELHDNEPVGSDGK